MSRIKKIYASEIVAVAYTGSEIQNFEQGEAFWIYAVDGDKIVRTQILSLYPKNLKPHSAILKTIDARMTIVPVVELPVRKIITPITAPIMKIIFRI